MKIVVVCETEGCNEVMVRSSRSKGKNKKFFHCKKCIINRKQIKDYKNAN